MVSVCLPSDALSQHLPSYLGFSYLGHRVSLHGCSSKAQPLLLTLAKGYLLTAAPPDLEHGVAPLCPPVSAQPRLLGRGVAPLGHRQDLLQLTPKKDILFIIGDWNAEVGSQETPGITGKFGLGIWNEAGQRLIEFCQVGISCWLILLGLSTGLPEFPHHLMTCFPETEWFHH